MNFHNSEKNTRMRIGWFMRVSFVCVWLFCSWTVVSVAQANMPPQVSNVSASERPHEGLVDITFDIFDSDSPNVYVTVYYSTDGGATWDNSCFSVVGNVGSGIVPGSGLMATWDVATDFPEFRDQNFQFRVYAYDGVGFFSALVIVPPLPVPMPVTFTMGSLIESDETPREVTLTGRFGIAATEVTNDQYVQALQWAYSQGYITATSNSVLDALDGSTLELLDLDSSTCQIDFSGGLFSTSFPNRPVVEVSWYGAVAYCDWLSLHGGLPRAYDHSTWNCNGNDPYGATGYRLPTEAEWEFACRAGTATYFSTGDCLEAGIGANFNGMIYPFLSCPIGSFFDRSADVGSYPANGWGVFDMHGNVYEWCNDWFALYPGDETNPVGAESGTYHVLRGGGWNYFATNCRSAYRGYDGGMNNYYGFRPAKSIP